jgi:hypothetical protein
VFEPPVIRTSSIDTWIWLAAVTFAPTWNTPPAVFATEAAPLVVIAWAMSEPTPLIAMPVFEPELVRAKLTVHTPEPRSVTLTATDPVNPAVELVAVLTSACNSAWNEAAVA